MIGHDGPTLSLDRAADEDKVVVLQIETPAILILPVRKIEPAVEVLAYIANYVFSRLYLATPSRRLEEDECTGFSE